MVTEIIIEKLISEGEKLAESFYKNTRLFLPFIARVCLLSSFIHAVYATVFFWLDLSRAFRHGWKNDVVLTVAIIETKLIAKTLGIIMVLLQKKVRLACVLLSAVTAHQMYLFIYADVKMFMRCLGILGGLIFLLAESEGKGNNTSFAGVLELETNKPKNYLKLSGRFLLIFMFTNFISLQPSFLLILQDILGSILMTLVVLGYKTKLSVLATIVYLNIVNFYENNWWELSDNIPDYRREYFKYGFFQGLSVTGGLLMIVLHGPGEMSLDEVKKRW